MIGMEKIITKTDPRQILQALHRTFTMCFAAAAGTMVLGAAALLVAIASPPTSAATIWVSGWLLSNSLVVAI